MFCVTQTEPAPPDGHPDFWPHSQPMGHAMALGHHVFPSWIIQASEPSSYLKSLRRGETEAKSELLHPHGMKAFVGMECNLQGR